MPDITFAALDQVPEGLKEHAKQVDGKFVVNVVPNAKLQEFRDNNIRLRNDYDAVNAKWSAVQPLVGDDIEKFKGTLSELQTTAQQVKDGKLKGSDAVTNEVNARLEAATESLRTQLKDLGTKLATAESTGATWKSKFERSVLHQEITGAVVAKDSPANPEALPDIKARFEQVFHVQPDGTLIPKKGDAVLYGADGASPMTPTEWLTKLVEASPYLGKPSAGGGAGGSRDKDAKFGLSEAEFNKLTPQERINRARLAQK